MLICFFSKLHIYDRLKSRLAQVKVQTAVNVEEDGSNDSHSSAEAAATLEDVPMAAAEQTTTILLNTTSQEVAVTSSHQPGDVPAAMATDATDTDTTTASVAASTMSEHAPVYSELQLQLKLDKLTAELQVSQ